MSNIVFSHKLPSEAHNLTFYVIYTTTTTTTTTTLQKSGKKFTLPLQNTQKRTEKILKIGVPADQYGLPASRLIGVPADQCGFPKGKFLACRLISVVSRREKNWRAG